ncbi:MAG TPA: hypothetical protein VFK13_07110 [Gemmatimonadaceae bacterium]|nr:hypothetical protein [Gemmatimonadaceae bacterium]
MLRSGLVLVAAALLGGCASGGFTFQQLAPMHGPGVLTAADLYATADSATRAHEPANAPEIIIVTADSVFAAISLYELHDIFWADIYVYNGGSQPFLINPSQLTLMDGTRTAFRELRPDEAANMYASQMRGIPPYQPKYTYSAQSSTQGYLQAYGNYAYYNATTRTTVTRTEDPYYALGYSIGAAIARERNAKLTRMASTLYTVGFVEGSSIPGKTGARGGVYWLKRATWPGPLILRFAQSEYEVKFAPRGR